MSGGATGATGATVFKPCIKRPYAYGFSSNSPTGPIGPNSNGSAQNQMQKRLR
jgi:hypothetical protein